MTLLLCALQAKFSKQLIRFLEISSYQIIYIRVCVLACHCKKIIPSGAVVAETRGVILQESVEIPVTHANTQVIQKDCPVLDHLIPEEP